jgi:hypothetical protein
MEDGFIYVGPFDDAKAAVEDQLEFVNAYFPFAKERAR